MDFHLEKKKLNSIVVKMLNASIYNKIEEWQRKNEIFNQIKQFFACPSHFSLK